MGFLKDGARTADLTLSPCNSAQLIRFAAVSGVCNTLILLVILLSGKWGATDLIIFSAVASFEMLGELWPALGRSFQLKTAQCPWSVCPQGLYHLEFRRFWK
jgi:hypothetical protein